MIARDTASTEGDGCLFLESALRLTTTSLCTRSRLFRKTESMKSVVSRRGSHRFRSWWRLALPKASAEGLGLGFVSIVGHVIRSVAGVTTELRRLRNYIGGEFKDAADGRTTEVVNPATGEVYATAPLSGQADVD